LLCGFLLNLFCKENQVVNKKASLKRSQSHHLRRQVLLDDIDINAPVESLAHGRLFGAGDPDLELSVEVKGSGRLEGESRDVLVGEGQVFPLASGDALYVDHDQPLIGEHEGISNQFESQFDFFALDQEPLVFIVQFIRGNGAGVSHQFVDQSHELSTIYNNTLCPNKNNHPSGIISIKPRRILSPPNSPNTPLGSEHCLFRFFRCISGWPWFQSFRLGGGGGTGINAGSATWMESLSPPPSSLFT